MIDGKANRIRVAAERCVLLTIEAWFLNRLELAVDVSNDRDYSARDGGTGNTATGVVGTLT